MTLNCTRSRAVPPAPMSILSKRTDYHIGWKVDLQIIWAPSTPLEQIVAWQMDDRSVQSCACRAVGGSHVRRTNRLWLLSCVSPT